LENYGALALLIFLRSQRAADRSTENKRIKYCNRKSEMIKRFEEIE